MKKFKNAFTLAETLITLMIVGVIAVMTIPALKDHSDESKYVAAIKKAYSSVSSAATAIEARHTDMAFWDCGARTKQWFSEVLNTTPNTGRTQWALLSLNGSQSGTIAPDFITADGMAWQISGSTGVCQVIIDTNGPQQPNVIGIDQAMFRVGRSANGTDYGVYPDGTPNHTSGGSFCTNRVIQRGNMPWLRQIGKANSCTGY